jgi:hypothetical protein
LRRELVDRIEIIRIGSEHEASDLSGSPRLWVRASTPAMLRFDIKRRGACATGALGANSAHEVAQEAERAWRSGWAGSRRPNACASAAMQTVKDRYFLSSARSCTVVS